jgi:hypothetical protein
LCTFSQYLNLPRKKSQALLTYCPPRLYNCSLYSVTTSCNVQHSTTSSDLPFDIIAQIINSVGENDDTDLPKELSLVSHSFLQICSKHLFATVELHDADPGCHVPSSKKGFLKLLKSRPEIINYIRKLTYKVSYNSPNNDDHLLSPILRTITRLNCLTITASELDWNTLDSSLTSAFLHLMHLPTISERLSLITSTSHLSKTFHCLVSLYLSSCQRCPKFVNSVLRIPPC